jgi:hypothetical protein
MKALMLKCSACNHRFPKFYTEFATVILATCPRCNRSARINVARLIATPADLRAAVVQAGRANGIIQHKEAC